MRPAIFNDSACVRAPSVAQRGFTLIELIMVIVILGVLAVFAAPRFFNMNDFNARGLHDETLALLRFAHKTAIAQRRTVCVTFAGDSATLAIAAAAGTLNCDAPGQLIGPRGTTPPRTEPIAGAVYTATPDNFHFDALGRPINGDGTGTPVTPLPWSVVGTGRTITVEGATGFVHE